ncbi:MAG TPA: hypothetical protein VMS96_08400 [Terriglobales bacterium]|nr:hypothetical protein [Terriglobales bacterium]
MKTYTGASGYVYQYYFVGKRPALESDPATPASEFIFDVTPDRKTMYAVSVLLRHTALEEWARGHGRQLTEPEQYAAAKLRLLQAFDELEGIREHLRLLIGAEEIEGVLSPLELD